MSDRLRVALGTVYPYDESLVRGGVEAVALYLTRALRKRDDIELHIVSCNRSVKHSFAEQRGTVTFHWLAAGPRLYNLRAATLDAWRVHRIYDAIKPDVIHAQGCSEYALGAPGCVPLALVVHGLELFAPTMRQTAHLRGLVGFYRRVTGEWITKASVQRAHALISIAEDYVPKTLRHLMNDKPVHCIPNPIDDIWFAVPDEGESTNFVLYVGSIIEHKNVLGLVQAFAQVVKRVPSARLQLAGSIGDRAYFERVQGEVLRLGIRENIDFLGPLRQDLLFEAYARSSIVVLASIQETAPVVIAEAMAAGRPTVTTSVGGIPTMVKDGATGYLLNSGDMRAMAERIVMLLQNRSKRQCMGHAAREIAKERFSAGRVAEKTVQVYRLLAGEGV